MKDYLNYFKHSEKALDQRLIGGEYEHLILDDEYNWVPYEGVLKVIRQLLEMGWQETRIDGVLLGAHRGDVFISLEPGSQFELSLVPQKTVAELDRAYCDAMADVLKAVGDQGKKIYALGYQPRAKLEEIYLIDKKRYHYMYEYFKEQGSMAHNMMKASAATQIAVDYTDEEDFREIYQLMNRLGPFLSIIFDNTPLYHGKEREDFLFRTRIWMNCDNQRCNLIHHGFDEDFGYEKYAEHILNFEPILIIDEDGKTVNTGHKKSYEVLPEVFSKEAWEHVLSMGFFDVRAKSYLEIRMMDSLPYPYNMAVTAMVKALVYGPNRKMLKDHFSSMDEAELLALKRDIMEKGFDACYRGRSVLDTCRWILSLCENFEEAHYLKPVEKLLERGENLSMMSRKRFREQGMKAMMDLLEVKIETVSLRQ